MTSQITDQTVIIKEIKNIDKEEVKDLARKLKEKEPNITHG
jgi:hypothetical protein